jgi:hypothetical protein
LKTPTGYKKKLRQGANPCSVIANDGDRRGLHRMVMPQHLSSPTMPISRRFE